MSYNKIITNFTKNRFSDVDLKVKASFVIQKLEESPLFSSLAPDVEELKQKMEIYFDFMTSKNQGTLVNTAQKRNSRKELEDTLQSIAFKVLVICKGDEIQLLSSGFDLPRKRTVVNILHKPANVHIKSANPGSLLLIWEVVPHACTYQIEYYDTSDPTEVKITLTCTKRKILISNLIPGHQYAFRICAVGSCLKLNWSPEYKSFVM